MGETVDALVVGAPSTSRRSGSRDPSLVLLKLATTDPGSVEGVYLPSYVRSLMIGTQPRQMTSESTCSWNF
jgi:hypothetical protein